jgi:hypothetical protein
MRRSLRTSPRKSSKCPGHQSNRKPSEQTIVALIAVTIIVIIIFIAAILRTKKNP